PPVAEVRVLTANVEFGQGTDALIATVRRGGDAPSAALPELRGLLPRKVASAALQPPGAVRPESRPCCAGRLNGPAARQRGEGVAGVR
ncbi:hypothetical protein ACWEM5_36190, partial [Streptomyces tendae]